MSNYTKHYRQKNASIMEKTREDQVQASDGGFVFKADDWGRLDRFLILGTMGGSYYASERELTRDNVLNVVLPLIQSDGVRVVNRVVEISTSGRAIKNDEALFVLALCASEGNEKTRQSAFNNLSKVARIGTHLFQFLNYAKEYRGWGGAMKRGVSRWYTEKSPDQLAYQMLKYRNRHGYTHADVLNLAHPVPANEQQNILFARALADQYDELRERYEDKRAGIEVPSILEGFEKAQQAVHVEEIVDLINQYGLTREMIPTGFLNEPEVWEAFLAGGMPMTAMVRNLGNMSRYGLLTPLSDSEAEVVSALENEEAIKRSRIHPIQLLSALMVYKSGSGFLGSGHWSVNPKIVDALDGAFYRSFQNVEPTGKRIMLGLDVSSSMTGSFYGPMGVPGLTPRTGSAAMALVTAKVEKSYYAVAFSRQLTDFPLSARQRLDDVIYNMDRMPFGSTRVPAPMEHALKNKLEVDAFVIYTDSETNTGGHPYQALQMYRDKMGIPAKLVVVGMVSNGFTVADPNDDGMLDVVGFDTAAPRVISEFIRG